MFAVFAGTGAGAAFFATTSVAVGFDVVELFATRAADFAGVSFFAGRFSTAAFTGVAAFLAALATGVGAAGANFLPPASFDRAMVFVVAFSGASAPDDALRDRTS